MITAIRTFAKLLLLLPVWADPFLPLAFGQDPFEVNGAVGNQESDNLDVLTAKTTANSGDQGLLDSQGLNPNERSAVVRSIRSSMPSTATELARDIQLMKKIRRWDEVQHWLDEVARLGIDETKATQMVQTAGTQTFLNLMQADVEISASHRASVKRILDLANASAMDPKRLRANVLLLQSPNKSDRIRAFRTLQSAGNRGIAALIDHHLSEQASAPNSTMSEAFSLMGKSAFSAWQAAMVTPHEDARGRLALLAARLGEPSLSVQLCTAASDVQMDNQVKDELNRVAAERNKSIPSGEAIQRYALDQMQKSLDEFQRSRWLDDADAYTTWRLAPNGRSILERPARVADLAWNRAVQLANSALRLSESADIDSALAMAVVLEDTARQSPGTASFEDVASILPMVIKDSFEFGVLVWDASEKAELSSAQLHAVRNLSRWVQPNAMPGPVRDRLAQALSSGYAAVRYEAAESLVRAMVVDQEDGSTKLVDVAFDGRNRLERTLAEMRGLEGRPLALIVGGSTDLRAHTKGLLDAFSFRVTEAASATQTMSLLRDGLPIESIFIVERVLEMDLGQLVLRIRANPATARCPIAILAASLSRGEHSVAAADPRVVLGSIPPDEAGFADILRRMNIVTQSPKLESANRIAWNEISWSYWNDRQGQFISTQPKLSFETVVESPAGQMNLIAIVLDKSQPLPKREQASQIFVQSVKRFGLLISTETANAQYDEYNTRGPDELDLRVVLGRVLDAIEASKSAKPWSEVAP